jgi:hypothetical protein
MSYQAQTVQARVLVRTRVTMQGGELPPVKSAKLDTLREASAGEAVSASGRGWNQGGYVLLSLWCAYMHLVDAEPGSSTWVSEAHTGPNSTDRTKGDVIAS